MDFSNLTTSERFALAALVVSILAFLGSVVGFIVNFAHTRRKFHQATNPELDAFAELHHGDYGTPDVELHNLSNSITITDLRISGFIRKHPPGFRGRRWTRFYGTALFPLKPLEQHRHTFRATSLAQVIDEFFPGYLDAIQIKERRTPDPYYKKIKHRQWQLRIVVQYRGGMPHSKKLKRKIRLILEPEYKEYPYKIIEDGETTEHEAAFLERWNIVRYS